jgi:hypothetical protein
MTPWDRRIGGFRPEPGRHAERDAEEARDGVGPVRRLGDEQSADRRDSSRQRTKRAEASPSWPLHRSPDMGQEGDRDPAVGWSGWSSATRPAQREYTSRRDHGGTELASPRPSRGCRDSDRRGRAPPQRAGAVRAAAALTSGTTRADHRIPASGAIFPVRDRSDTAQPPAAGRHPILGIVRLRPDGRRAHGPGGGSSHYHISSPAGRQRAGVISRRPRRPGDHPSLGRGRPRLLGAGRSAGTCSARGARPRWRGHSGTESDRSLGAALAGRPSRR